MSSTPSRSAACYCGDEVLLPMAEPEPIELPELIEPELFDLVLRWVVWWRALCGGGVLADRVRAPEVESMAPPLWPMDPEPIEPEPMDPELIEP